MKLISFLIVALGVTACHPHHAFSFAQESHHTASPAIAGDWAVSFETPHGTVKGTLKVQQEGSKVTGNCELEGFGSAQVTGTLEGKKVALNLGLHGGEMKLTLNGTLDGDKMSGQTEPMGGSWSAARQ